jgi:ATP-dependent RNA helicase DDX18/HAS1
MDPPPTELLVVYSDQGSSQPQDNNRKEEAIEAYKKIYTSKVSSTSHNNSSNNGAGTGQELALRKASSTSTTGTTLTQEFDHCFVKVPRTERLSVLFATIRRSLERKVIVVCSTWESCHFHAILFRQLEMAHVYELHEGMDNVARAYAEYAQYYPGILFASEMQIREFDIPSNVDYMVQYEPPMNPTEYIYRMSTTRLQDSSCHKALLFLTAEEDKFLHYFTDQECDVMELEARKVSRFHTVVEALVSKHPKLNCYAWDAFRSFMVAYKNHSHVDVYDRSTMDESEVVRSFGMPKDPSGIIVVRNCKELVVTTNNNSSKIVDTTMKKNVEKVRRLTTSENSSNSPPPPSQKPGWMKGEGTWRERNSVNKSWSNNQKNEDTSTRTKKEEMVDEESIWKKTVGTERTWRTGHKTKSWMTKDKTWKHSHVHL